MAPIQMLTLACMVTAAVMVSGAPAQTPPNNFVDPMTGHIYGPDGKLWTKDPNNKTSVASTSLAATPSSPSSEVKPFVDPTNGDILGPDGKQVNVTDLPGMKPEDYPNPTDYFDPATGLPKVPSKESQNFVDPAVVLGGNPTAQLPLPVPLPDIDPATGLPKGVPLPEIDPLTGLPKGPASHLVNLIEAGAASEPMQPATPVAPANALFKMPYGQMDPKLGMKFDPAWMFPWMGFQGVMPLWFTGAWFGHTFF